jgi:Tfp pilus assembly protein FimT
VNTKVESGFSALELVTVMGILVILSAIAIPNIASAREGYALLIASDRLSQQFSRCRQEAVRLNDRVKVKVTSTSVQIDTNRDDEFTGADDDAQLFGDDASVTTKSPADGVVEFTSRGEIPIGFSPSFIVRVGSRTRLVSIDPRGAVILGPEIAN